MCGIVGIIDQKPVAKNIVSALKCLEYRGYDSAGIATLDKGHLECIRATGKLINLEKKLKKYSLPGTIGIGHTRWATHGEPSEQNAHPHTTEKVAVVHNGIIENFKELREMLNKKGYTTTTQTDTEVIAKLLTLYLDNNLSMKEALETTLKSLQGAFALAIISPMDLDKIYFARKGSPLVIGIGENSNYIASDAIALASYTHQVIYPEEGDWGYITQKNYQIFNKDNKVTKHPIHTLNLSTQTASKGAYRHFMEKEIFEQSTVLNETLSSYLTPEKNELSLPKFIFDKNKLNRLTIIACGTSYYAACIAKYWIEKYAKIPVEVDIASEFRYRQPALGSAENHACLFISQSGETIDTLEALRYVKAKGLPTISIVNVTHSSISRETDSMWPTFAGPEIGVASTKAFSCQLMTLACFTLGLAKTKINQKEFSDLLESLKSISMWLEKMPNLRQECLTAARTLAKATDVLYLGRGTNFPMALEGALKLKEISYIHAEAYAAGEMKHGPIALIDALTPIVALAPNDNLIEKTISNLQEASARGGKIISLGDAESLKKLETISIHTIEIPTVPTFIQPFILTLPMQLLAYETALLKGTDVDQPRNLAKSVTVE